MYTRYDGRLTFKDLNSNPLLNGVQTSSLRKLWTPQLAFINALGPYQTLVDDISVCTIVLEKTPTFNDLTQSLECKKCNNDTCNISCCLDYGFNAYTNAINLQREYYQEFACEFDLYYYPFDTQVGQVYMTIIVTITTITRSATWCLLCKGSPRSSLLCRWMV